MKKLFMHDDFLLQNRRAAELYHRFAENLPIIDYHCHIQPAEVSGDKRWDNLAQIWLAGDHYKWRAMRSNGVSERFCTGDATDREKFQKWAETVPYTLRNPLYHWTHLELKKPFGIVDRLLGPDTAQGIWEETRASLAKPEFSCRGIIKQWKVEVVCSTDDPVDSLEHHLKLKGDASFGCQVRPTFRPDKAFLVDQPAVFNAWLEKLGAAAGAEVRTYGDLLGALRKRAAFFHDAGCRLSDFGHEQVYAADSTVAQVERAFADVRAGRTVGPEAALAFKSALMTDLGRLYHELGWTMQIHVGALRNNNTRLLGKLGPDTGFDTIGDFEMGRPLSRFLDRLDTTDQLPRTILYNLNPRDNELMGAMIGNFQDGSMPGKIQYGSAWWFLDQKDGMERQIEALSQLGLLSRFVGMLTDSRSFLSYSRHEYFRRILCNRLGLDMEQGLVPDDVDMIGRLVQDVCYHNARRYFGFYE